MEKAKLFKMLTFASCLGMIQNGDISYDHLVMLVKDMEVAQVDLQKLQVQSKFMLQRVYKFRVWRLHNTIQTGFTAQSSPSDHQP